MDAIHLMNQQLSIIEKQLVKVTAGVAEEWLDAKPISNMFTVRESLKHLADVYGVSLVVADGGTPEFGKFEFSGADWESQVNETFTLRTAAVQKFLSDPTESSLEKLTDYVLLHDAYHVGQLVAIRGALDPSWNSYSIYD